MFWKMKGSVNLMPSRGTGIALVTGFLGGTAIAVVFVVTKLNFWFMLVAEIALLALATVGAIYVARRYGFGYLAGVLFGLAAAALVASMFLLVLFLGALGGA